MTDLNQAIGAGFETRYKKLAVAVHDLAAPLSEGNSGANLFRSEIALDTSCCTSRAI
jgi:hypothetical protein